MIYTPLTKRAMEIAYKAHDGQTDICGTPYIFHPYHLAEQMTDETTVCVALLHDVVEDTKVTIQELEKEFPQEVVEAVELLTHDPSVDYCDYIRHLKHNPIAKKVKLADLTHNEDETRLIGQSDLLSEKREIWREKYKKAREVLQEEE